MNQIAYESIIHQLEFMYTNQDWRATKEKYERLNSRLPKMSCCGLRDDFHVDVDGVRVNRREAFRLADELFMDGAAFYKRALLYNLNLQQEIIKAVQAKQSVTRTAYIRLQHGKFPRGLTCVLLFRFSFLLSSL
jgi:hypothetical protein